MSKSIHALIPARVAMDVLCSVLDTVRAQLQRRQRHGKDKPGRAKQIDLLKDQLRQLGAWLADPRLKPAPDVDSAVVGLLAAWATGHFDSLGALEDYLRETGHPAAERVAELLPTDYASAAELLLFGEKAGCR